MSIDSNIIEELKKKLKKKRVALQIKMDDDFREKIEYICTKNEINKSDYIEHILLNSEIEKVYKKMKKDNE